MKTPANVAKRDGEQNRKFVKEGGKRASHEHGGREVLCLQTTAKNYTKQFGPNSRKNLSRTLEGEEKLLQYKLELNIMCFTYLRKTILQQRKKIIKR